MKTKSISSVLVILLCLQAALHAEQGSDNPTGVTGGFNGNITTAGSYDPYTGNALREVDDIVVPGTVGAYPLKWARYFNSHTTYQASSTGGRWRFSYIDYSYDGSRNIMYFPDGRAISWGPPTVFGIEEWIENNTTNTLHMSDGGKVVMQDGLPLKVIDPYGQVTTIITTGSGASKTTKVTEPGGRYLLVNYNPDGTVSQVRAFDGVNSQPIQSVTYTWQPQTLRLPEDQSHPTTYNVLTNVGYSDGTSATYSYLEEVFRGPCVYGPPYDRGHWFTPVLLSASDVRYPGPMRQISYAYATGGAGETGENHTRIASERKPSGEVVSSLVGVGSNVTAGSTETRGDGPSRTFNYHSQGFPDCPPLNQEGEPPERPEPQPLDGKLISFTDFSGNLTSISYETDDTKQSAGFVTAVTDANGNTTTYTRSSLSWAILRITHPPTASEPQGSHIDQTYTDEAHPYYLASRTDENGHTTVYHRDDAANPNAITRKDYADGSFETFAYNNFGQVLTHRLANGAYQHFSYDGRGLLQIKTNPTWTADHNTALASDAGTTYTYYGAGDYNGVWTDRVKTETDPRGLVAHFEYDHSFDSNGNETTTPAAGRGLVTKIFHVSDNNTYQSFGYNKYGDKLWEENELRQRTTYTYDDYGRVLTVTNPLGKITTNDYRPSNNPSLSPYVHTTSSVYKMTTPMGIVTQNTFDENFRKKSTTTGYGTTDAATTWFQYDLVGNPTKVTDPRGSGPGDPTYTTTTDYDHRNRKWHVTDPLGHQITFGYDPVSNVTTITRPDQTIESKTYDVLNRVLTDTLPKAGTAGNVTEYVTTTFDYYPGNSSQMAGQLWHVTDAKQQITTFQYEPSGMKTQMTYPNNTDYQSWTYDTDHNLIARRTVNGVSQLFGYDSRNRSISMTWSNALDWATFGYDAASRMTSAQNPTSIVTRTYDDAGRLMLDRQKLQIMPVTAVSRKTHGTAGTFDVALPLTGTAGVECRSGQGSNADQHQIVVSFPRPISFSSAALSSGTGAVASTTTSSDGKQVTVNLTGITNAQTIVVTLSGVTDGTVTNNVIIGMGVLLGDATGNGLVNSSDVAQTQSQSGQTVTSSNFGQDITVNGLINSSDIATVQAQSGTGLPSAPPLTQPGSASPNYDVQYSYDDDGKDTRLYVTSAGYDYTFGYDGMGRFKTISVTGNGPMFQYSYDTASNETHRTNLVNGVDQVYGRDALNRITRRDLVRAGSAFAYEVYGYDPQRPGLLTSVDREDGKRDQFGYDLLPEISSGQYGLQQGSGVNATDFNPEPVDPIAYGDHANGYDPTGPVGYGNPHHPGGGTNFLIDQSIDPSSAQTDWSSPNRTCSYTWDKAGNRISMTDNAGPSCNYSTTNLNQYWTDGTNPITNGSQHELASYKNVLYKYINDTHLSSITGNGNSYQLNYDALGRCAVRNLNGVINYYIYDGEKPILEYGAAYGFGAANLYGRSIDEILKRSEYISRPSGTGIYDLYYQDDHEGNITHLTDPNGSIIEWYRYDAFGAPTFFNASSELIGGSNWNNRFLFTGREHMLTFSVYEYRNRAYHPALGRFMSEDPKDFDAGDYNLFRYCHNDPEDLTDPMGLDGAYVSVNPVETIQLRNPLSDSIEATKLQKIQQTIRASMSVGQQNLNQNPQSQGDQKASSGVPTEVVRTPVKAMGGSHPYKDPKTGKTVYEVILGWRLTVYEGNKPIAAGTEVKEKVDFKNMRDFDYRGKQLGSWPAYPDGHVDDVWSVKPFTSQNANAQVTAHQTIQVGGYEAVMDPIRVRGNGGWGHLDQNGKLAPNAADVATFTPIR